MSAPSLLPYIQVWEQYPKFYTVAQNIPISLLELNTFGHAVCALLIYLLWWEKPFEVDYPTMIQNQTLWDIRALSFMRSHRSSAVEAFNRHWKDRLGNDSRFQAISKVQNSYFIWLYLL